MKITDIKTYPIWVGTRNQLVVKVETDEGIVGWSQACRGASKLLSARFATIANG